jgi:alkylation response protein AidB-like acyl-CoA dehydrogenase
MDAQRIVDTCIGLAAKWTAERDERLKRRALDPADFDALREAGYPLLAVPTSHGGAWNDVRRMTRPICDVLGALAAADPSLALVASMHPSVLSYWLTSPDVPDEYADAWLAQRKRIFQGVVGGDWWGTITSEPGSGGDVLNTRTAAVGSTEEGWRISGEKHFGSGSGATTHMVTTARGTCDGKDEELPDIFTLDVRGVPWDGSRGMKLLAEWDGHGMAATQSHGFRFDDFPAERIACPMVLLAGMPVATAFYECLFTAVVAGVLRAAVDEAALQIERRGDGLRAYERVEWSRTRNEAWLAEQAFAGVLRALEEEASPVADALRGKTVIAELAESALGRIGRVLGGGTFARRSPFGTWAQDVRALGFLRPPWGLAFDQLWDLETPDQT